MALGFGIKTHMRNAELLRRNAYERMFKHTCARSSAKILSKRSIRTVMQSRHCFRIWTHLDATIEYAIDDSENETAFFFQRDWSGFVPRRRRWPSFACRSAFSFRSLMWENSTTACAPSGSCAARSIIGRRIPIWLLGKI